MKVARLPYALQLRDHLVGYYGAEDLLPALAASWIARYPNEHTQRSYVRSFKLLVSFARDRGIHPLNVTQENALAFMEHLKEESGRGGKPLSDTSRVAILSAVSTFFEHRDVENGGGRHNPFAGIPRPSVTIPRLIAGQATRDVRHAPQS
jgi:integrase/recombinase XerD